MENTNDKPCTRLGTRIALERQLLVEEKWIIYTLKKIKNQRNCLQIERLQLESMKTKLKPDKSKRPEFPLKMDISQMSAVNMMQSQTSTAPAKAQFPEVPTVSEVTCNGEELDLSITNSVFANHPQAADCMEEIEEDDDDELDAENIMLDIDMLMNAADK